MSTIIRNIFAGYALQNVEPERGMIVTPSGQGRTNTWGNNLRGTVIIVFTDRESVSVYWHGGFIENEMKPNELIFTGEYQVEDAPELLRSVHATEAEEAKMKATESWLTRDLPGDADISEDEPEWEQYCA